MELNKPSIQFSALLLLLSLAFSSGTQAASLYKWTDADGNTHYSQTPPEEGSAQKLQVKDKPATQPEKPTEKDELPEVSEKEARRAEIWRKNCEIARSNLESYKTSKRVMQEDGTIITLSDEMRKSKIQEAQKNIDKYCP